MLRLSDEPQCRLRRSLTNITMPELVDQRLAARLLRLLPFAVQRLNDTATDRKILLRRRQEATRLRPDLKRVHLQASECVRTKRRKPVRCEGRVPSDAAFRSKLQCVAHFEGAQLGLRRSPTTVSIWSHLSLFLEIVRHDLAVFFQRPVAVRLQRLEASFDRLESGQRDARLGGHDRSGEFS
jgi:hypothetical protein